MYLIVSAIHHFVIMRETATQYIYIYISTVADRIVIIDVNVITLNTVELLFPIS